MMIWSGQMAESFNRIIRTIDSDVACFGYPYFYDNKVTKDTHIT